MGQGRRVGCCRGIAGPVLTETCVAGLQCVCQLCEHTNFTCQTEGACWASVMLTNGKEEVIKSCVSLPELNAQVFCHSSKNITKTECCYTDFCNNITLRLPVGACCGAALGAGSRTEAEGGGVYGCHCWGESLCLCEQAGLPSAFGHAAQGSSLWDGLAQSSVVSAIPAQQTQGVNEISAFRGWRS